MNPASGLKDLCDIFEKGWQSLRSLSNATTAEHSSCTPCLKFSRTPVNSLFDTKHHAAPLQSSASPPHPSLNETQMRYEGPRITFSTASSPAVSNVPRALRIRSVSTSILPGGEGSNSSVIEIQPTRLLIPARHRSEGLQPPLVPIKSVHLKRRSKRSTESQSAIDLLPMWLQQCKSLHGDACRPPNLVLNNKAPRFLVDLQNCGQIIFTAQKTGYDYAALSYHRLLENHVDLSENTRCSSYGTAKHCSDIPCYLRSCTRPWNWSVVLEKDMSGSTFYASPMATTMYWTRWSAWIRFTPAHSSPLSLLVPTVCTSKLRLRLTSRSTLKTRLLRLWYTTTRHL